MGARIYLLFFQRPVNAPAASNLDEGLSRLTQQHRAEGHRGVTPRRTGQ